MRILRTAAVLVLLALSLGTPAFAAKARPAAPAPASKTARNVPALVWRLVVGAWTKEGCGIEPLGRCGASAPTPPTKAGCTIDPWGRCGASAPTQDVDSGCTIDPLGRCLPGH